MMNTNTPNQHLMALVTFIALVPLVYWIPELIEPFLPANKLLHVITAVGIIVPIIAYGVVPTFSTLYHRLSHRAGCWRQSRSKCS
ncbi:hypothetical protein [Marinobacter sp.]|uniref:hypothetical protein n=1 Tax=Marinobacter sp. TaxID=50741 RepID=UPI003A909966|tara:strand:+ start:3098 stop:3352 length:255 start_codon:yes stop_codon:yes gene_type:complete